MKKCKKSKPRSSNPRFSNPRFSRSRSVDDLSNQVLSLALKEPCGAGAHIPFLACNDIKDYFLRSKIMIIMKGLPGSGKSSIAKSLSDAYPRSVICSADKYFERNNKYKYDSKLLMAAHTYCQKTAIDAAQTLEALIIIDNTNVQNWEMKFYVKLADRFNYVVFVIEPQNAWSKNVSVLAEKNSHGLDVTTLKKKLKLYENVSPLFFGWFLNEADSYCFLETACDWLARAFQVAEFKDHVHKCFKIRSLPELLIYFSGGSYPLRGARLLHCTSRYSAKENQELTEEYMRSEEVGKQLGTISQLLVVGFFISPNTYGARVELTEEQLHVWANDVNPIESAKKKKRGYYPSQNSVKVPLYSPDMENLKKSHNFRFDPQNIEQLLSGATVKSGCKAHVTLGTAEGVPPVQTGLELLELFDLLQRNDHENVATYDLTGASLVNHGGDYWGIYPKSKLIADAFFSYQL